MKISARLLRHIMNLWPPFLGAGIRVTRLADDFKTAEVVLRLGLTNRNYVGVHFGGSLYAMTDPFYMLLLIHNLGRDYIVWDQAGSIEYLKPGTGRVTAYFSLDDDCLNDIRQATANGEKHLPELTVEVKNEGGETVARVKKTLYVRKKKRQA